MEAGGMVGEKAVVVRAEAAKAGEMAAAVRVAVATAAVEMAPEVGEKVAAASEVVVRGEEVRVEEVRVVMRVVLRAVALGGAMAEAMVAAMVVVATAAVKVAGAMVVVAVKAPAARAQEVAVELVSLLEGSKYKQRVAATRVGERTARASMFESFDVEVSPTLN